MAFLHRALNWAAATFNDLPVWKGECRVWSQRMRSPNFERWLYLRAHQLGLMGRSERVFLEKNIRPGMRILDVGSNLGLYAISMARAAGPAGRVVAFEPDPDLFAVLRRNCEINGLGHIETHNLALGSARATLTLHKMIINSGDNHLGAPASGLFRRSVEVPVVSLDEFLPGLVVDLVKIDVQGWELEVLRGMRRTLEANRTVRIYFEFSPHGYERAGSAYGEIIDFLRGLEFRILDAVSGAKLDAAAIAVLARSLGNTGYTNLVAAR